MRFVNHHHEQWRFFGDAGTRALNRAPASPPLRYVMPLSWLCGSFRDALLSGLVIQGFSGSETQGRATYEHLCASEHGGASQTLACRAKGKEPVCIARLGKAVDGVSVADVRLRRIAVE